MATVTVVVIRVDHNEVIVDIKVADNLHYEMMIMADMQSVQDSIMDLVHKVADHSFLIEMVAIMVRWVDHHVVEIMMHNFQRYLKF